MGMKSVFTEKKLLITTLVDLLVSVGGPFLVFFLCYINGVTNFVYPYLFAIFVFVNGFLAYFVGDMIIISYKSKNDIVTSGIPSEVLLSAKHWRYPFIICLLFNLVLFAVCAIIYTTTGSWPLL